MKKTIFLFACALSALPFQSPAQKLALEKTYEIDRKAKRGFLDAVTTNPTDKTTTLSFVTKASNNMTGSKTTVKYQNYIFDKDYNFVKVEEVEQEYKNKRYRGDNYSVEGVSVEMNMMGKLVLKKKLVEYTWSWFNGGYTKKVTLLDKVKPKDESGNSYYLLKKFENDETGDVIALVKTTGKTANQYEHIFIRIDKNLNIEVTDKVTFSSYKTLARTYLVPAVAATPDDDEKDDDDEDIFGNDICFIFAAAQIDKKGKEDPHDYTMLRVNANGKIISNVDFKVPASAWNIQKVVAANGSLYFIGPANDGDWQSELTNDKIENMKWKFFQLVKMNNDKVEYATTTNMDDFEAKLKKPASQKKNPAYKGKRFRIENMGVTADGSLFICGQNFKDKEFQDVMMFYFDSKGILKAQYGVKLEENGSEAKAAHARMFIDVQGNSVFWTIWEMVGYKEEAGKGERPKALIYPSISKIDLGSAEIGEFIKFGLVKEKPTYFLQNKYPYITNPDDHSQIYLGVDKKGNTLWFGKVIME